MIGPNEPSGAYAQFSQTIDGFLGIDQYEEKDVSALDSFLNANAQYIIQSGGETASKLALLEKKLTSGAPNPMLAQKIAMIVSSGQFICNDYKEFSEVLNGYIQRDPGQIDLNTLQTFLKANGKFLMIPSSYKDLGDKLQQIVIKFPPTNSICQWITKIEKSLYVPACATKEEFLATLDKKYGRNDKINPREWLTFMLANQVYLSERNESLANKLSVMIGKFDLRKTEESQEILTQAHKIASRLRPELPPDMKREVLGTLSRDELVKAIISTELRPYAAEVFIKQYAFGPELWGKHFQKNVGKVPPLPKNILEILTAPCPIWPGKVVCQTHNLVLIPATVDGVPWTLNELNRIMQTKNMVGRHGQGPSYGNTHYKGSYWALVTNDLVPDPRLALLPGYENPRMLEAATCLLANRFVTGKFLPHDCFFTHTRVDQGERYSMYVGCLGLVPEGLDFRTEGTLRDEGTPGVYVSSLAVRRFETPPATGLRAVLKKGESLLRSFLGKKQGPS